MGVVIKLEDRRAQRARRTTAPVAVELLLDLGDPFSYLAAERVERTFETVTWTPVPRASIGAAPLGAAERARAEARADELRMPLVWPEHDGGAVPRAMRVAALAAECGRGAAFALAAGRLAFCGGFHLDDPEILAEAAAAAGLGLDACLDAAADRTRDAPMRATGARLRAAGVAYLPVLRVGGALFAGEERLPEAVAASRLAVSS